MHLHLIGINPALVNAWFDAFADFPEVEIQHGDLLNVAHGCIVSPANSYGFMDGGIDAAYRDFFGLEIEKTVQAAIAVRPEGLLPVGACIIVPTGNPRIPHLIVAPTMVMPEMVESLNCQRAMRAVLRIARQHPDLCSHIYCPGLATGVGRVPPEIAALEMAQAYRDWKALAE